MHNYTKKVLIIKNTGGHVTEPVEIVYTDYCLIC